MFTLLPDRCVSQYLNCPAWWPSHDLSIFFTTISSPLLANYSYVVAETILGFPVSCRCANLILCIGIDFILDVTFKVPVLYQCTKFDIQQLFQDLFVSFCTTFQALPHNCSFCHIISGLGLDYLTSYGTFFTKKVSIGYSATMISAWTSICLITAPSMITLQECPKRKSKKAVLTIFLCVLHLHMTSPGLSPLSFVHGSMRQEG